MSVSAEVREQVRHRANFACEYCGVTETDVGGELTLDHFHPQAHGGSDDLSNLLYCCHRCNEYKAAYWPAQPTDPALWNPRQQPRNAHVLLLADGTLYPTSPIGDFTLRRLRLNRRQLVAYRLQKQSQAEELRLLTRYRDLLDLLERLSQQQAALLEEHRQLLREQRELLQSLVMRQR
jgi:hypothetical protein